MKFSAGCLGIALAIFGVTIFCMVAWKEVLAVAAVVFGLGLLRYSVEQ